MRGISRLLMWIGMCVLLEGTVSCQYYEDFRVKKTTADLQEERAALLHDYGSAWRNIRTSPPRRRNSVPLIPNGSERSKSRTRQASRGNRPVPCPSYL